VDMLDSLRQLGVLPAHGGGAAEPGAAADGGPFR
jgi:hypothetical protein